MIKLTAHLGADPLRYHIPIRCIAPHQNSLSASQNFIFSIGESGQILCWNQQNITPVYQIVPSVVGDADKVIDLVVTPLRQIGEQKKSDKVVTMHEDGRLRVFSAQDGVCINVSQHNIIPEKLVGIVQNPHECRFLFCFSEKSVYVMDSWTMKVLDHMEPSMDSFSMLKKGRINADKQLQLMDRQSKSYRIKINYLFSQIHIDVGSWISNHHKANRLLMETIETFKQQKTVVSYRKIQQPDHTQTLQQIKQKIKAIKDSNIWQQIFDPAYMHFPLVQQIMKLSKEQTPVISNCFFIKNSKLWYFFGTNKGRIFGFPAIINSGQNYMVENPPAQLTSAVAYLNVIENLLIVSWENGRLNLYTIDNLDYTIQNTLQCEKKVCSSDEIISQDLVHKVDFNANKVFTEKASSEIKYRLEIYCIRKGKTGTQTLAFQLNNNEIILIDTTHRRLSHFRGMPQNSKIYAVLEMDDYIGIAHSTGIDMFSSDRYERTITYDVWIWSDYQFCEEFRCKNDYHNILTKNPHEERSDVSALHMLQFTDRFYKSKIDYYSPSLDLLYETFGMIDSEMVTNQLYPNFHFIQRAYTERSIHSTCNESLTSVIRLKHNNTRRQKYSQTSYLYQCSLNKQLDAFSGSKSNPLKQMQQNFLFFSLLFWDHNHVPFLSDIYTNSESKFIMKRRYVEQGLGKSFTIYFDNKSKHQLSSQLITYSSIASISILMVCTTKQINLTDDMVRVVEEFTHKRSQDSIHIDVNTLSKMCLSDNHSILKACISILMSSAMTLEVPLHPIYEYFILNLKKIQESKNRVLTQTQTMWFVYLGIGFIYSTQAFDKDQVTCLIMRLIDTIELKNFELRPDLTVIVLKVFNEGVKKWKSLISNTMAVKIFMDLFKIFFCYDGLSLVKADDKKFNFCFQNVSPPQIKKMKHALIKTVIYLLKEFENQFLQVLRVESINQKTHPAYPASVIQILRQYIKSQKPKTNLVFYIELLLNCLSPMTPSLRKYVQKNVLDTLQLLCSYENISFNHPSQKLSLKTQTNIYIYCLRTSTKWRTISLREQKKNQKQEKKRENRMTQQSGIQGIKVDKSILQMSPKGTYIALLSDKLKIWRLSSGFWSGVLGAFSQGWSFQANGSALKWDEKQDYITVINDNPSQNRCFKL